MHRRHVQQGQGHRGDDARARGSAAGESALTRVFDALLPTTTEAGYPNVVVTQLGFEPTSMPGEQFQRAVVTDLTTWSEIVAKANIKPQ
jgi:hypothetical protein